MSKREIRSDITIREILQPAMENFGLVDSERVNSDATGLALAMSMLKAMEGVSSYGMRDNEFQDSCKYASRDWTSGSNRNRKRESHLPKGLKILVVDDNSVNTDIACYHLGKIGAIVDTASNGKEAIARCLAMTTISV